MELKILYVQFGTGMGGSKISLYQMVKCASSSQKSFLALSAPVLNTLITEDGLKFPSDMGLRLFWRKLIPTYMTITLLKNTHVK